MARFWRLGVVVVVAVAAFFVAIISFRAVPFKECQQNADFNPAYEVKLEEKPSVDQARHQFSVRYKGQPVTGAKVCMRADMGGAGNMSGMGVANLAREVAPGEYEVPLQFQMGGPWQGQVIVVPKDTDAARIPVFFTVS